MTEITKFRHGDVFVERIDALPANVKPAQRDAHGRIVLAVGEASGHAHAIRDKHVTAFVVDTAERAVLAGLVDFIEVGGAGAQLHHEYVSGKQAEHDTITLPPGKYRVGIQRQYSPQAILRAAD